MKITGLILATLFAFIVARTLGANAWGKFSLALSLITFAAIIAAAGFDTFLLKITSSRNNINPEPDSVYRKTLQLSFLISVVMASLLYVSSSVVASSFFNNPELTHFFKIASFAIPAYAFTNINAGFLQGLKAIKKYVFIRFVAHHAGGLLLFLLLLSFQRNDHNVIIAYTVSLYIIAGISYLWVRNRDPERNRRSFKPSKPLHSLTLLIKGFPFMLAALLFFMKGWVDTIMIGIFMNETNVGIYNITLKLTTILGVTLSAVSAVSTPLYSEAYSSGNLEQLKEYVSKSSAIVFYTSLPLFLVLILFPEIILSLFGDEFRAGATALIILAAGGFINAYFGAAGYLMKMTGSEVVLQYITLITVLAGILLNYYLIPAYGLTGAATATTIAIAGWNIACAVFIRKNYSVSVYYVPKKPGIFLN